MKPELCFLFFEWQCIGSGGSFDKHRIIKRWPKDPVSEMCFTIEWKKKIMQNVNEPGL